jgi:hypothetical protein
MWARARFRGYRLCPHCSGKTLAFRNPNKEWVVKELDALICEWRAWQKEVEQLGEDLHDPFDPKPGQILADGEENIKKHRILQAKTLEFLENNIAGHGFITGRNGTNIDRTVCFSTEAGPHQSTAAKY